MSIKSFHRRRYFFLEVKNNTTAGSDTLPPGFQNATTAGSDTLPQVVAKRYPNNNNLNNNNITTTRDVVVDFKKDQGEEKMQEIRERMREFNFTESFTEKVLKEYPVKKIEEKLELYAEGRQVRNPEGFLGAALKEDYGVEIERSVEQVSPFRLKMDSRLRGNDIEKSGNEDKKILSREEAIKRIQEIRKELADRKKAVYSFEYLPSQGIGEKNIRGWIE